MITGEEYMSDYEKAIDDLFKKYDETTIADTIKDIFEEINKYEKLFENGKLITQIVTSNKNENRKCFSARNFRDIFLKEVIEARNKDRAEIIHQHLEDIQEKHENQSDIFNYNLNLFKRREEFLNKFRSPSSLPDSKKGTQNSRETIKLFIAIVGIKVNLLKKIIPINKVGHPEHDPSFWEKILKAINSRTTRTKHFFQAYHKFITTAAATIVILTAISSAYWAYCEQGKDEVTNTCKHYELFSNHDSIGIDSTISEPKIIISKIYPEHFNYVNEKDSIPYGNSVIRFTLLNLTENDIFPDEISLLSSRASLSTINLSEKREIVNNPSKVVFNIPGEIKYIENGDNFKIERGRIYNGLIKIKNGGHEEEQLLKLKIKMKFSDQLGNDFEVESEELLWIAGTKRCSWCIF